MKFPGLSFWKSIGQIALPIVNMFIDRAEEKHPQPGSGLSKLNFVLDSTIAYLKSAGFPVDDPTIVEDVTALINAIVKLKNDMQARLGNRPTISAASLAGDNAHGLTALDIVTAE